MAVQETETGAAVLEIDRFEFAGDHIELVGSWSGIRARRFIRPTLVLHGEGEDRRLLAVLEHKPWAADDGEEWVAAFPWKGDPQKFESADLHVASGIDLKLPPPRMRQGKPRRFKQRIVSFDSTREAAEDTKRIDSPGIVTEPIAKAGAPAPTEAMPAVEPASAVEPAPAAEPASAPEPDASAPEPVSAPAPDGSAVARLESLRRELDTARTERDRARDQVRALRAELEDERQAREKAVADARASERASATTMLSEGAELRASVERQRELAYTARDEAVTARDKAIEARDKAFAERDEAVEARRVADRQRDDAVSARERAHKERDRAVADRDKAFAERDDMHEERDDAFRERDQIVSIHERDLPIHQPRPRFTPEEPPPSDMEIWMPRAVAGGILLLFLIIVLRLFGG